MDGGPPAKIFKSSSQTSGSGAEVHDESRNAEHAKVDLEIRRSQLRSFFLTHRDEEWFKEKYHPHVSAKRKEELDKALKKRAQVFLEMLESGRVDSVKLDSDQEEAVVKLLDAVVIRLEGGTNWDLTVLDLAENSNDGKTSQEAAESAEEVAIKTNKKAGEIENKENEVKEEDNAGERSEITPMHNIITDDSDADEDVEMSKVEINKVFGLLDSENYVHDSTEEEENWSEKSEELEDEKMETGSSSDSSICDGEDCGTCKGIYGTKEPITDSDSFEGDSEELTSSSVSNDSGDSLESLLSKTCLFDLALKPTPLHKTSSVFLPSISPKLTRADIEKIIRNMDGYLRLSLSDPKPDKLWFRCGWAVFRSNVKIEKVCSYLGTFEELTGATVSLNLKRRVGYVSSLSAHQTVVINDLKVAARVAEQLDTRHKLWAIEADSGQMQSNPVLKGVAEYLAENDSSVEDSKIRALPGQSVIAGDSKSSVAQALEMLDRLLLYLRIVHSVDYYNMRQYVWEDEDPYRCGIIYLREVPFNSNIEVPEGELKAYCQRYTSKLEHLTKPLEALSDAEVLALGAKSTKEEIENFYKYNSVQYDIDRWRCPLSGKKFIGPEFVKQHINRKFPEKIVEVEEDVKFFENYLRDPRRPFKCPGRGNSWIDSRDSRALIDYEDFKTTQ